MQIEKTSDLRRLLLDTIEGVKSGTVEARDANAIASLSRAVLTSAKIDLDYMKYSSTKPQEIEGTLLTSGKPVGTN